MFGKKKKSDHSHSDDKTPPKGIDPRNFSTPTLVAIMFFGVCCLAGAYFLLT